MHRNGLWASVMLALIATTVHSLQQCGVHVYSVVMSLILFMGVGAVPYAVLEFRKLYRPILSCRFSAGEASEMMGLGTAGGADED
jgi:hypothetical protein|eukprot:2386501-Prymnesium_polylepis.1